MTGPRYRVRGESGTAAALLEALAASDLFKDLSGDDLAVARDEIAEVHVAAGDVLLERGAPARHLYVLVTGELEVLLDAEAGVQQLSRLAAGSVVGEIGLFAGEGRSATVRAHSDAELVALSAKGLQLVLAEHPEQGERLARQATDRLRRTQLIEHFMTAFGVIDAEVLAVIEHLMAWTHVSAGERLFAQGDAGHDAYLVATGRLSVCRSDGQGRSEQEIGEAVRGDIVGELALLDDQPRSATVYAVRDTSLIRFSRAAYDEILERYPSVGLEIAKIALRRGRNRQQRDAEQHGSIAVAAVSPSIDLRAFVEELTHALGPGARLVTTSTIDAELGRPGAAQIDGDDIGALSLAYHLEALQVQHQHLVYELDGQGTPWSKRALRWADHVLFVADATDPPDIGPFEAELWALVARQRHQKASLALLHPPDTARPSGTPRWLEHRTLFSHHHLRRGDAAHMARLARLLAGKGTSVVLSGGGARGIGHLAVLRALADLAIPIDMVGGTSIGAIMAAQPGMGWTNDEMDQLVIDDLVRIRDYTLPVTSLLRGERISNRLRKHFAGVDITDLWVPYFCTVTNLTRGTVEYLDHGALDEAIRASISIPGALPPVPRNGELYVDGGVLDNIPVAEMRRRNPTGTLIAVDVSPDEGSTVTDDYGLSLSGLRALVARRRGSAPPSLMSMMVRSSLVASAGERERAIRDGLADLYLELPIECSDPLDFTIATRVLPDACDTVRPALRSWATSRSEQTGGTRPLHVRTKPPRHDVHPDRRRRRRGVLLLTLRDARFRAARFGAVVVGIAVVLTLLFLMTGLVEQFHREPRDTVAALDAEYWMLRDGASGAFTSAATMPADVVEQVEGVTAAPVVLARHSIVDDGAATDVVVVGFAADRFGQPPLVTGALPSTPDEVVIDAAAGLDVADEAVIGGRTFVVSGLTERMTMFAGMPLVFLPIEEAQAFLYRGEPLATAVLLDGTPSSMPEGFMLATPADVAADATRPLERSISSVNLIRVLLWMVAALIIGTMTYLSALERRRDVAVLKAVGASTGQLATSIALQGVLIALAAAMLAAALQMVVAPVFPLDVSVPHRALLQVPAIAVVVSLLAGLVGLRKAVSTDPALAFSGPTA